MYISRNFYRQLCFAHFLGTGIKCLRENCQLAFCCNRREAFFTVAYQCAGHSQCVCVLYLCIYSVVSFIEKWCQNSCNLNFCREYLSAIPFLTRLRAKKTKAKYTAILKTEALKTGTKAEKGNNSSSYSGEQLKCFRDHLNYLGEQLNCLRTA